MDFNGFTQTTESVMSTSYTIDHGNNTERYVPDGESLELYGWPGPVFYAIHILAILCLCSSMIIGTAVLILFFRNLPAAKEFWKQTIGDRLMVYLVVIDVAGAVNHAIDHAYILFIKDHPPDMVCRVFGMLVYEFASAQVIVITFTSISACVAIVLDRKLRTGRYDWRLLLISFGIPLVIGMFGIAFRLFGPSGAWYVYYYILSVYLHGIPIFPLCTYPYIDTN